MMTSTVTVKIIPKCKEATKLLDKLPLRGTYHASKQNRAVLDEKYQQTNSIYIFIKNDGSDCREIGSQFIYINDFISLI